jgi:metal-responsive CopG/Arc/MetJ family transcriptional regulator
MKSNKIPITISLDEKMLAEIDRQRGIASRSAFIRKLLEESLQKTKRGEKEYD